VTSEPAHAATTPSASERLVDQLANRIGGLGVELADVAGNLQEVAGRVSGQSDRFGHLQKTAETMVSANHGIVRLWTQEDAPFWKQTGFQPADEDTLKKLPAAWLHENSAWLTLQLKSEEALVSMEKELAIFMQAEKARTAKMQDRARIIKAFATIVAVIFGVFVIGALIFLMRKNGLSLLPRR